MKDYKEFKKEVKPITDVLGLTDKEIRDTYNELELRRIKESGINGAKAGKDLRNILLKLSGK